MVLQDRLGSIKMLDYESVTSFLGRFIEIRDSGPRLYGEDSLKQISKTWGPFVRGIVAREVLPTWERLWDYFVQEETRLTSESSGQQHITEGDEDLDLC
jgi:hypothetical protein